jgi:hypothetical protein
MGSIFVGKKYQRAGPLFQGRCEVLLVDKEVFLKLRICPDG